MIDNRKFIVIPRGRYLMGLSGEKVDRLWDAESNPGVRKEFVYASCPVHAEEVEEVLVCARLVTRAEFERFASSSGYRTEAERDGWGWVSVDGRWMKKDGVCWRRPFGGPADGRYASHPGVPVMQVSWNDASAYCRWLGGELGARARLPREIEWEIFARVAGVPGFGSPAGDAARIPDSEVFCDAVIAAADREITRPGLLWEWTEDWYERYPGGDGHRDFGTVYRVLRGGSALSAPVQRTLEFRLRKCPTARSPYYGFRAVVTR